MFIKLYIFVLQIVKLLDCGMLLWIQDVLFQLLCFKEDVIILLDDNLSSLIFEKVPSDLFKYQSLQVSAVIVKVMKRINQNGVTIIVKVKCLINNRVFISLNFDFLVVDFDHVGVVLIWVLLLILDLIDSIHRYFFNFFKLRNGLSFCTFDNVLVIIAD